MEKQNTYLVPGAIIVAAVLIGGAVLLRGNGDGADTPRAQDDTQPDTPGEVVVAPVTEDDHILGNPNAPIQIVEFSDIDCPFCSNFHITMKEVMDTYGPSGEVAWIYRHFPLDQLHPQARRKAEATECVADLGGTDAFWTFTDTLFERTDEGLDDLRDIAVASGVDGDAFQTCFEDRTFEDEVQEDYNQAIAAGGTGTPYSVVITAGGDTFPINGAQPFEVVDQVIKTIQAGQ